MSLSGWIFFARPTTSSSGTRVMSWPLSPTITPKAPSAIARTAAEPKRSAALDVTEDKRPRLLPGAMLDVARHLAGDPAEPVHRAYPAPLHQLHRAVLGPRPLGHDDDAEVAPRRLPAPDLVADLLHVERNFRDQDDVGAAGEPAVECDPAGVTTHDLRHHHALVAFGRRVQPVERLGRRAHRRIEAERPLGAADVVVDRLGHAHHGEALAPQLVRDLETAVAAYGDERVESAGLKRGDQIVRAIGLVLPAIRILHDVAEGIAAVRGAENGPAEMGDAADRRGIQRDDAVEAEQSLVPALNTVAPPATAVGGQDHGADDGVQSGGVSTPGRDGDPHRSRRTSSSTSPGCACRRS
jgi:hypothetical protein